MSNHPVVEYGLVAGGRVVGVEREVAVARVEGGLLRPLELLQRAALAPALVLAPHAPHAQRARPVVWDLRLDICVTLIFAHFSLLYSILK